MSRSVIYLNRCGRFFLRRDGCGRKFSRSRARQWWRTSDPMVVSAGADLVSIGVDVVSIGVVSIGDDVLSIGANIDRRDGGSVGSGGGTCAWASAKPDSKKNKEKLAVLVTFCFIIIAPRQHAAQTLTRNLGDA
jgi:hypothetical protein